MDWTLVQRRNHSDTFGEHEYHRDMQESPELISRFPAEGTELSGESYCSERQKKLRRMWQERTAEINKMEVRHYGQLESRI